MKFFKKMWPALAAVVLAVATSTTPIMTAYAATPGSVGTWNSTSSLPTEHIDAGSVEHNGYVYEIGGTTNTGADDTVYYAKLNADGTVGTWNTTTALPAATEAATAVTYNGYVYLLGGWDGFSPTLKTTVYFAKLNANGTVGTWGTTTSLPDDLYYSSSIAYQGHIYEIGGFDDFGATDTVYEAAINSDGTIGSWQTTMALPNMLGNLKTVEYNGYVYALGGYRAGTDYDTVYYAKLNTDGTVGTWNTTASLPVAGGVSNGTAVVYNGYVFMLGGSNGGGYQSGVYSAPINTNGTVGTWGTTTSLPYTIYGASSIVYNGKVYEIGGSNGLFLNTVYYAPLSGYPYPGITNQNVSLNVNSSVTVDVLSGVSGNPDPATLRIVSGPSHGTAVDPPSTITYTPNIGYAGNDSLVYQVCSLNDASVCSQATLSFTVVQPVVGAPDTGNGAPASHGWAPLAVSSVSFLVAGIGLLRRGERTRNVR